MDRLVADGINAVINPPLRVIANGDGFAVHFTVDVPLPGGAIHEDIIEIFKIVADGHVEGVRAFVTPRAMAPIS